jgi:hypothetical protein
MMEAASPSETSANFYQTTRRHNPEDSQPPSYSPPWEPQILLWNSSSQAACSVVWKQCALRNNTTSDSEKTNFHLIVGTFSGPGSENRQQALGTGGFPSCYMTVTSWLHNADSVRRSSRLQSSLWANGGLPLPPLLFTIAPTHPLRTQSNQLHQKKGFDRGITSTAKSTVKAPEFWYHGFMARRALGRGAFYRYIV